MSFVTKTTMPNDGVTNLLNEASQEIGDVLKKYFPLTQAAGAPIAIDDQFSYTVTVLTSILATAVKVHTLDVGKKHKWKPEDASGYILQLLAHVGTAVKTQYMTQIRADLLADGIAPPSMGAGGFGGAGEQHVDA